MLKLMAGVSILLLPLFFPNHEIKSEMCMAVKLRMIFNIFLVLSYIVQILYNEYATIL